MSFNLISQLTKEDRIKIENFIRLYGIEKDSFIGLNKWLKYWGTEKIKLYKLLGNNLIYQIPFSYEKNNDELTNQMCAELIEKENNFPNLMRDWFDNLLKIYFPKKEDEYIYFEINRFLHDCLIFKALVENKVTSSIKFKFPNKNKMLQIQKGAKPMRAISRILDYCKDEPGADHIISEFEKFRIKHSMILNDKLIKGTLTLSIHPLDFITMSDNSSNWQSCMSWTNEGCYRIGTVEMMNSNNVLCCYIENKEPYYFNNKFKKEEYTWKNKKFRQLFYINKDIIVGGKSYPFANDDITKKIIEVIRDLAEKNLNWTYNYGIEPYRDMQYIKSSYSMQRAKDFIYFNNMVKHNIIFDTKGMYNDMLNDKYFTYWCVRNKVKHNKVISYSGKSNCLCCNGLVIEYQGSDEDYNDRYYNCNSLICDSCKEEYFTCDGCRSVNPLYKYITVYNTEGTSFKLCKKCAEDAFKKCPDCGKVFTTFKFLEGLSVEFFIKLPFDKKDDKIEFFSKNNNHYVYIPWLLEEQGYNCEIFCCKDCAKKIETKFNFKKPITTNHYLNTDYNRILEEMQNINDWSKYFYWNLEKVEINDGQTIDF